MPRFPIKPLIKLSKEQWKVLMERLMTKEGKLTEKMAGAVMARPFEPPAERTVGALFKPGVEEGMETVERLPIKEARAKYLESPEQFRPGMVAPNVKAMSTVTTGSAEELASGLAYERIKQAPIVPSAGRTARFMQRELEAQESEAAVRKLGILPEDIRPGVKPSAVYEEKTGKSIKGAITVPPASELASDAMIADQMWKNMGGGRGLGAKVWENYRASSRQSSHISNSRDYFISSFVRWKQAPKQFTRAYPREAKILNQLWKEFEESLQPPPVAIPGTNLPGQSGGGVAVGGVD